MANATSVTFQSLFKIDIKTDAFNLPELYTNSSHSRKFTQTLKVLRRDRAQIAHAAHTIK
jgi:hypothetical protein